VIVAQEFVVGDVNLSEGNDRIVWNTMEFSMSKPLQLYHIWALRLKETKTKQQNVDSG
jgi:hypothetical protein